MTTIRLEILADSHAKLLHAIHGAFPQPALESTCDHPALIEEYEGRIATLMERIESLEATNKEQARLLQAHKMDAAKERAAPTPAPAPVARPTTHTRTAGQVSGPISDLDEIPF